LVTSGLQNFAVTLYFSGWQNLAGMPGFAAIHEEQRSTRHQHQVPLMSAAMERDMDKISNDIDAMSIEMEANEHIGIGTLQRFNTIGDDIKAAFSKAASAFDRIEQRLERIEQRLERSEQQRERSEQQRALSDKRIDQILRRLDERDILVEYQDHIASFRSTIICNELAMPWQTLRILLEEQASKRPPVDDMQQAVIDVVVRKGISEEEWQAIWKFSDLSNRPFYYSVKLPSAVQFLENRDNKLFTLEYAREPLIKMLHIMIESEDESESSSKKRKR
jgi:hypothetical protein